MGVLTHPSIQDGWFREISSQWPGQAMSLKVNKILHVEKSKFQDVLVFESETYGNVLVLDRVIQCTERDEFSYQEMITHIPMSSHPNPKHVLVIGGGDGGVVREVLKHPSVEKVVLCDIDEAVVRVSKIYLPHMSTLLADKRVEVFIGDGFKFLEDNKGKYDVIITDSSDPVGPAESLFQQPYFQLLHDALTEGGNISTQGECLWLHLPLISGLKEFTSKVFPVSEYAYTTIPTYPSGQIGFMICSKDPKRDFRTPLRSVSGTRYYNSEVHKHAFVLPEFGRAQLAEGKDVRPHYGRKLAQVTGQSEGKKERKILLLGSGFVALPCVEYLARDPFNHVTIACRTLASSEQLASGLPSGSTTPISLDVSNTNALETEVAKHDLVISLIPYTYHAEVIKAAIKASKPNNPIHVVTTSYVSPAMRALDEEAKKAGVIVYNEIGLDPGIDHLWAVKAIGDVRAKGGKIIEFHSYCGGLPSPMCAPNPLGYKFSWSSRGVLLALLNDAKWIEGGKVTEVKGKELMGCAKKIFIKEGYAFVGYPNRDSSPFSEFYNIPEAQVVVRGTLRYEGFPGFIKALVEIGFLDASPKDWLKDGSQLTWKQILGKLVGVENGSEVDIIKKIKTLTAFSSSAEEERIISGFRWIGLFSDERAKVKAGNLLDTLCTRLEELMAYEPGERDLVMLQHKFVVEWADGKRETLTSTLEAYGSSLVGGHSAMALLVGLPCGIATQLVLEGKLGKVGVQAPYNETECKLLRDILEKEGVGMVERVL